MEPLYSAERVQQVEATATFREEWVPLAREWAEAQARAEAERAEREARWHAEMVRWEAERARRKAEREERKRAAFPGFLFWARFSNSTVSLIPVA